MAQFREAISGSVWLSGLELLFEINGNFQNIKYYHSKEFGRTLIINDELQHVEAWAPFYHEVIVHLPCSFIKRPTSALILGGGSLFAAAELLKYDSIKLIDLVDYDVNIITATNHIYPETSTILTDPRLKIIFQECKDYLRSCSKKYDIIINDCFDLYAEDKNLNYDLYDIIYKNMSENGICSDLIYRSIYHNDHTYNSLRRIEQYNNKALSLLAVPEYPGVLHVLTMWGRNKNLNQHQRDPLNLRQISMHKKGRFKIYSPQFLCFYLYLPPYLIRSNLDKIFGK